MPVEVEPGECDWPGPDPPPPPPPEAEGVPPDAGRGPGADREAGLEPAPAGPADAARLATPPGRPAEDGETIKGLATVPAWPAEIWWEATVSVGPLDGGWTPGQPLRNATTAEAMSNEQAAAATSELPAPRLASHALVLCIWCWHRQARGRP